jgi:shikimate kinase
MSRADNVFLVGPMGSGKSTIGRQLAEILHKQFRDCDHEIEAHTGAAIPLIFEIEGEEGFRRRESAMLDELTREPDIVLATGGGAVLSEQNRSLLHARGVVVYLHAPIEILLHRTQRDRNRPLLQNTDRRAKFEEIMAVREPLYRALADVVINTSERSPAAVARDVIRKLQELNADDHVKA